MEAIGMAPKLRETAYSPDGQVLSYGDKLPTARTLEEEPLNETDLAAAIRGLAATAAPAMLATLPVSGPAAALAGAPAGMAPSQLVTALLGGTVGAEVLGRGGRKLGEATGYPETLAALGELIGGYGGASRGARVNLKKVVEPTMLGPRGLPEPTGPIDIGGGSTRQVPVSTPEITVPEITPPEVPIARPVSMPQSVDLPAVLKRSIASTKDTVKVYSGGESGTFWTTDPARAASYGSVREVEVPRTVFEAGRAEAAKLGQPSPSDTVLPNSWVKKATVNPDIKPDIPEITDEGTSLEDLAREFGATEPEAPSAPEEAPAPVGEVSPAPPAAAAPPTEGGGEGAGLAGLTARVGGQTVRVGDTLPDGRKVLEIDEATGIPILTRRRQEVAAAPVPKVPALSGL